MSELEQTHKAALLHNIRSEHESLDQTLEGMSATQMTTPGVYADDNGEWTVKDILAHITWWEQSPFDWLGLAHAVPRSPIPKGELSEDETNNAIFEGSRNRSLDDVWSSFHRSYQQLVSAIEAASEEQLNQPRKSAPDGPPIWEIFPGNTYEHYRIHHDSIRAWLDAQGSK